MSQFLSTGRPAPKIGEAEGPANGPSPLQTANVRFWLYGACILALAAAVRFAFIARYDVWLDEAYCFIVARKSIGAIIADLRFDNGPPLYYLLLNYWMKAFGESAAALRALSAVFSTGAVCALLAWNSPWFPRRARLFAGFLLAVTPLAVYYAQETRMYAPVLFLILVSMIFLEKGLRLGKPRHWAFFAFFTAAAFYTSYVAVFLAPVGYIVTGAAYMIDQDSLTALKRIKGLVIAHAAAAALFAPWVPVFLNQPSAEATQWMVPLWRRAEKTALPFQSLSVMTTGGAYYPKFLRNLASGPERTEQVRRALEEKRLSGMAAYIASRVPAQAALALMIAINALMLIYGFRSGGGFPFRLFLGSWIVLSILAPFLLSFIRPMYFVGRYEISALPGFAALCGIGLARMPRKAAAVAAFGAGLLFLYSWAYMEAFPKTGSYEGKGEALAETLREGDVVLCLSFEYAPVFYYCAPGREKAEFITYPRETLLHAAWIDYNKWLLPDWEWTAPRDSAFREARDTLSESLNLAKSRGGRLVIVKGTQAHSTLDALNEPFLLALVGAADAGRLSYDESGSQKELGILVMRVIR